MAEITFKGDKVHTVGDLPQEGSQAPDFKLTDKNLDDVKLSTLKGKKVILNIFPSLDTSVCAQSVREFNKRATAMDNTLVLSVSKDLPFAHSRFCTSEGIDNVISASEFKNNEFGETYGVSIADGPLSGLFSRAVVVIDEDGKVKYTQQVPEIADEPDYDAAINAL